MRRRWLVPVLVAAALPGSAAAYTNPQIPGLHVALRVRLAEQRERVVGVAVERVRLVEDADQHLGGGVSLRRRVRDDGGERDSREDGG